jgi:hypothetical protein
MRTSMVRAQAERRRGCDALDGGETILDDVVDEIGKLALGEFIGGDDEAHDRRRVGVGFHDGGVVAHVGGELAADAGHGVAYVHCRGFEVGLARELDRHPARAVGRVGRDRGDALHARDGAFDDGGDLGVHRLRRRALVAGAHGDDGTVDVREFADLDALQRRDAGNDDQQVEHHGEHGAADEGADPAAVVGRHLAWLGSGRGHGGVSLVGEGGREGRARQLAATWIV